MGAENFSIMSPHRHFWHTLCCCDDSDAAINPCAFAALLFRPFLRVTFASTFTSTPGFLASGFSPVCGKAARAESCLHGAEVAPSQPKSARLSSCFADADDQDETRAAT
jgi:hypothetical protein